MINRLLIANRGEIARRIARTASTMGIETVGVYAEGDASEPFVTEVDRAVGLGGRSASETYLNVEALLQAAAAAGADAVHPGYGFLSESAAFARAVLGAGLVWVGPPPGVIEALGDKLAAKGIMSAAGLPVLPSREVPIGAHPDPGELAMPLMVKAAAGGGGKGMRVVDQLSRLADAVASARREAGAAFGDATVFLEPYLQGGRHVEVQILADDHGTILHCFERECSIQRRHQKLIEECPSPAVDQTLRQRMAAAALAAAKAVGYRSAGTVEFLVDRSGGFWFLEVNTRLQVEHRVTEAVTGLDLVYEQLRVAQGLPLSVTQEQLEIGGHAIEARLYAEDPESGFLPASGCLVDWEPALRQGVQWDSGVETGSRVGVEFDPMLAKVISHAPNRHEAAAKLAACLAASRVRGIATNRDFLVAALRHPDFASGRADTSFVERSGVSLRRRPSDEELRVAAATAALCEQADRRAGAPVLGSLPSGWRNSSMPEQKVVFTHRGSQIPVGYRALRGGAFAVAAGGWQGTVRLRGREGGFADVEVGTARHRAHVLRHGDRVWVQGPDGDVELGVLPRFPERRAASVEGGLVAPMPGTVVAVEVATGEQVDAGQLLVVMEAMKMEHRLSAPRPGVVAELRARPGQQVGAGELLVVLGDPV